MKRKWKKIIPSIGYLLLAAAVVLAAAFYPEPHPQEEAERKVVRVWNIDTFEGGKGSRTSFLKNAARRAEKKMNCVYYLVSSYTLEGARSAFEEGCFPDVLSFGIGLSEFAELSLPLSYDFSGGKIGEKTLAYPWCRGGYALFSLTEDFTEEGKVAISSGGNNLVEVAAIMNDIEGETLPALSAYTKFLNGEYRYLLGTQRDLCRFQARNVNIYFQPLPAYSDLYQYISLLNPNAQKEGLALLEQLLSAPEKIQEIGMFPVVGTSEFAVTPQRTLGVFTSRETISGLEQAARVGDKNFIEKFLKTI